MKKRRQMHLLLLLGVVCVLVQILLNGLAPDLVPSWILTLTSPLGGGLAGSAVGNLKRQKRLAQDPAYQKRQRELHDERNTAIRCKAGDIAGDVCLVAMILVVIVVYAMELIPLWLLGLLGGIYIFKYILEELLYRWLQRKM